VNDQDRMAELRGQGFYCSQIIVAMALELQGADDPAAIRASAALAGGLGFTGELCGALTGGASMLGLYAGRGRPSEDDDPRLVFMTEDLVAWFREGFGRQYGGIRCAEILGDDRHAQLTRCPAMVAGTYQKAKELLVENGFDLTEPRDAAD
jgi:C_GCAxxG_C_C family probable redox protein